MSDFSELELDEDDPRILESVREYMAEVEAGRVPNRRELEARFPDLADQLAPYFGSALTRVSPKLLETNPRRDVARRTVGRLSH